MKSSNAKKKRAAVFFDRDGVLNEVIYHQDIGLIDTPFTEEQFRLIPESAAAVARVNNAEVLAVLVSNQPGVAKKHFTLQVHQAIDQKLTELLAAGNAHLDARYYCLDHPEAIDEKYRKQSNMRKPSPGMILAAFSDYNIDPGRSWLIGDSIVDIQAAHAAGIRGILVGKLHCYTCRLLEKEKVRPDLFANTVLEAVGMALASISNNGVSDENIS